MEDTSDRRMLIHNGDSSEEQDARNSNQPVVGGRVKMEGHIGTYWISRFVHLSFNLALGVYAITNMVFRRDEPAQTNCDCFYEMIYSKAGYWVISMLVDAFLRKKHLESRIEGFLEFYNDSICSARWPHIITNSFNALLLAVASVYHHKNPGVFANKCQAMLYNPIDVVGSIILIEVVINAVIILRYILKVRAFNKRKSPPDALRDEWMSCFIRDSFSDGEVGFRAKDDVLLDLLWKQADLLRHYKENNEKLLERIMANETARV